MLKGKHLVVFGGNGYLGQRIINCALKKGVNVVSINRSGPPANYSAPEFNSLQEIPTVKWHKADIFDISSWQDQVSRNYLSSSI